MLDFVSVLPDAREGVRRLSQVLSGIVVSTRISEVRAAVAKGASQSFTNGGSFSAPVGARLLSSDDAQLAQESVDRLAALIALGPPRSSVDLSSGGGKSNHAGGGEDGEASTPAAAEAGGAVGLDGLPEEQAEQYLTEMYDMLLRCRVPEALGELTTMASSALLGPNPRSMAAAAAAAAAASGSAAGASYDEAAVHDEAVRRRSVDLRASLDLYVRDGGPSPARASIEGLLCNQKLGGHAQALLESISQLLLSCVFDPIWRHRDLLAQPRVRELVVALSCSALIPAFANICIKLRTLLARPATLEAASHAWLLGFVAKNFTGLCRCMKAMVEFEACAALWAQLGDAFGAHLMTTRMVERFSAAAAAVHPSYLSYRMPAQTGSQMDLGGGAAAVGPGAAAGAAAPPRPGETYLELCGAVEVFLEGLFHLTWHFTARAEEAAAAGPPPPLLVRDVLAAMEPEGSGSVADLLAAAAAAATAADVRSGALAPLSSLLSGANVGSATAAALWPALVSGPATHSLAADWLAHVVARMDGGELLVGSDAGADGRQDGAPPPPEEGGAPPAQPLLHQPGPVDRDELPLLLSVCLAVAAAGASSFIATGGPAAAAAALSRSGWPTPESRPRRGRRSIEILLGAINGGAGGGSQAAAPWGSEAEGEQRREAGGPWVGSVGGGSGAGANVRHATRVLKLTARGLKAMAASQDAELAPYPAIHAAHACAVAMHKILQESGPDALPQSDGEWAPGHTSLLMDSFLQSLMCYSAFLHPDPDKDPLTLRAVERCHEQLLDLCTATGKGLRQGVASVVYAAQAGLLPSLEAVLRAAALTCRLETLRVLLAAVMNSVPALQRVVLSRDGYLFLTLRKLMIACINLACPNPLEHPLPAVQPNANSRRSLTLILQQCSSAPPSANSTAPNSGQNARMFVPDRASYQTGSASLSYVAAFAGGGGGGNSSGGRPSGEKPAGHNSEGAGSGGDAAAGRPLILPLSLDLLDMVCMLAKRFIEVHDGRVAAAVNLRIDINGAILGSYDDEDGEWDELQQDEDDAAAAEGEGGRLPPERTSAASTASSQARRRRSFEREATELMPLAQMLPFALWWLGGPMADLVDALAQEVINDDGSGSLFGDALPGTGGGGGGGITYVPNRARSPGQQRQAGSRRGSIELQRQRSPPRQPRPSGTFSRGGGGGGGDGTPSAAGRRRQSVDLSRLSPGRLMAARWSNTSEPESAAAAAAAKSALPSRPGAWSPDFGPGGDRAWKVLSRCADALHVLFRLMVTLSDLNRRAPHPDWMTLVEHLQPQQLMARAVQVLVHGALRRRQQLAESGGRNGRSSYSRGPAFPLLLSSLLSAAVCGVQYGWLVPASFGIPSATVDPSELEQMSYTAAEFPPQAQQQHQQHQQPAAAAPGAPPHLAPGASAGGGAAGGPLFSRVRRFTVMSANPEGRAYQWAMVGDCEEGAEGGGGEAAGCEGDSSVVAESADEDAGAAGGGGGGGGGGEEGKWSQRRRPVVLLQAAAPGGAWSNLAAVPGPAVVPTRALQVLVTDYGSAADKVLFELLLRGLSSKRNAPPAPAAAPASFAAAAPSAGAPARAGSGTPGWSEGGTGQALLPGSDPLAPPSFFWVPPTRAGWLHTCSNPCCMNLSGLQEAHLPLAACPRCGEELYCSRHCQAMHWHAGHKARCRGK